MITPEENDILDFLKPLGKQFATAKEVCRRAGGKEKWIEDPEWAKPLLKRMERKGLVEANELGHYRIRRKEEENGGPAIDPRLRAILAKSGMDVTKTYILQDDEKYRKPPGGSDDSNKGS